MTTAPTRCRATRRLTWPGVVLLLLGTGLLGAGLLGTGDLPAADPTDLRLNQIQVIGTHNSYHRAPAPALLRWLARAGH